MEEFFLKFMFATIANLQSGTNILAKAAIFFNRWIGPTPLPPESVLCGRSPCDQH